MKACIVTETRPHGSSHFCSFKVFRSGLEFEIRKEGSKSRRTMYEFEFYRHGHHFMGLTLYKECIYANCIGFFMSLVKCAYAIWMIIEISFSAFRSVCEWADSRFPIFFIEFTREKAEGRIKFNASCLNQTTVATSNFLPLFKAFWKLSSAFWSFRISDMASPPNFGIFLSGKIF